MFSAHSKRGAAASKAVEAGISVDTVLRAGHWASASTLKTFYHREVATDPSLVEFVLNPDGTSSRNEYLICSRFSSSSYAFIYAPVRRNAPCSMMWGARFGVIVRWWGSSTFIALKITVQID